MNPPERYDAFLSYRSSSSGKKAVQLRQALHSLGKRHGLGEAIEIFLDLNSLKAGSLGENIAEALEASRTFVLLVDSTTHESPWVTREIEAWLASGGSPERLFLVRNDQNLDLSWNSKTGTFASVDLLPPPLRGLFPDEQKWFDVSGSKVEEQALGGLYAAIMGVSPELLQIAELQHQVRLRRSRALLTSGLAGLLALALVAGGLAFRAYRQSEVDARRAEAESLAAQALLTLSTSRADAVDQAVQAADLADTPGVRSSLLAVANGIGSLQRTLTYPVSETGSRPAGAVVGRDSTLIAWGPARQLGHTRLVVWSTISGSEVVNADLPVSDLDQVTDFERVGLLACSRNSPVVIRYGTWEVESMDLALPNMNPLTGHCRTGRSAFHAYATLYADSGTEGSPARSAIIDSKGSLRTWDGWVTSPREDSPLLLAGDVYGNRELLGLQHSFVVPKDAYDVKFLAPRFYVSRAGSGWFIGELTGSANLTWRRIESPVGAESVAGVFGLVHKRAEVAWIDRDGVVGWSGGPQQVTLPDPSKADRDYSARVKYRPSLAAWSNPTATGELLGVVGTTVHRVKAPDEYGSWSVLPVHGSLYPAPNPGSSPWAMDPGCATILGDSRGYFQVQSDRLVRLEGRLSWDGCVPISDGPPLTVAGMEVAPARIDGTVILNQGLGRAVALVRPQGSIEVTQPGLSRVWQIAPDPSWVSGLGEHRMLLNGQMLYAALPGGGYRPVAENVSNVELVSPDGLSAIVSSSRNSQGIQSRIVGTDSHGAQIAQACLPVQDGLIRYLPARDFDTSMDDAEAQVPAGMPYGEPFAMSLRDCRTGQNLDWDSNLEIATYELSERIGMIVWRKSSAAEGPNTATKLTYWRRGDASSLRTVDLPTSSGGKVDSASLTPDGANLLVFGSQDSVVTSFQLIGTEWQLLRTYSTNRSGVKASALSPDGTFLLAFDTKGAFDILDAGTGRVLATEEQPTEVGRPQLDGVSGVVVTGDGAFAYAHVFSNANGKAHRTVVAIPSSLQALRSVLCTVQPASCLRTPASTV